MILGIPVWPSGLPLCAGGRPSPAEAQPAVVWSQAGASPLDQQAQASMQVFISEETLVQACTSHPPLHELCILQLGVNYCIAAHVISA